MGKVRTTRTCFRKCIFSNKKQNRADNGQNRQILSFLGPLMEFKLCTAGICLKKIDFCVVCAVRFAMLFIN